MLLIFGRKKSFHYLSLPANLLYELHLLVEFKFHNKRHPKEMGEAEIVAFLSYLASEGKVAVST